MQKIVVGNWKMHGSQQMLHSFMQKLVPQAANLKHQAILCPQFIHIPDLLKLSADCNLKIGAQNCSDKPLGAFTGEVAAASLKDLGCSYVIVGHSERREYFAEMNATLSAKLTQVQAHGMLPIFCVGESAQDKKAGNSEQVVLEQLQALESADLTNLIIAYEPVWAIGTGSSATPELANAMHALIKDRFSMKIPVLYGGSVKPENIHRFFAEINIDGALVGGASLDATDFIALCS